MVKTPVIFLFLLLGVISTSYADTPVKDAKLMKEFGPDLMHAPFYLRFSFEKAFHKDWQKSYFYERREFLEDYEKNQAIDQARQAAQDKEIKQEENERLAEKKDEEIKKRDRLRAAIEEEKQEKQDDDERRADFNKVIKEQESELQRMEEQIKDDAQSDR